MAQLLLAPALTRWLANSGTEPADGNTAGAEWRLHVDGTDVAAVLDALFERFPTLRSYLLDEQGVLRHHVAIFVDGRALPDKRDFSAVLSPASEVYLAQALSGG
jgi:sulfur-carrier protein